jgi:hypothetical protein
VDVSTFGGLKTVTNAGNGFTFEPTVIIEFSNELVPVHFAPLWTFGIPDEKNLVVAARWMRATVTNYKGGGAPVVNVGGDDTGATFATLVATAASGAGAGVDVSALADTKTIHVAQAFRGALNVEISEDGGATYSQLCTFYAPGYKSLAFAADFMRVTRGGVPQILPGLPIVNVGATAGSSGGGSGGLDLSDGGVPVAGGPFTTLNFVGVVSVTDGGGGVAIVAVDETKQVFRYVATGAELATFPVALPAVRASVNYNVQCTMGGPTANGFQDKRPLVATFAVGTFDVECPTPPEVGDIFMFTVEDLT